MQTEEAHRNGMQFVDHLAHERIGTLITNQIALEKGMTQLKSLSEAWMSRLTAAIVAFLLSATVLALVVAAKLYLT